MDYYYSKDGDIQGPESLSKLIGLYEKGQLNAETLVCTEGSDSWLPLSSLEAFQASLLNKQVAAVGSFEKISPPPVPRKTYEYKVVPFVAILGRQEGKREGPSAAANQLEDMIKSYASNGWEYVRLESVETHIAGDNGCFGLGATPATHTVCSMVVFRR